MLGAVQRVAVFTAAAVLAPALLLAGTAVAGLATGDPLCYPGNFTCTVACPSRDLAGPPDMDVTSVLARSRLDGASSTLGYRALLLRSSWSSGS